MRNREIAGATAAALSMLLCYGILTIWVPDRWALALYQASIFGLAAVWAAGSVVRPFPIENSAMLLPLGGVVAFGLYQLAAKQTIYAWETWNATLNWATAGVLFFLALQVFGDRELRRRFLQILLYFGFALSVVSTVQMFTSDGKIFWVFPSGYSDFVLGPFVYRNQYAAFMETILPLALYRAVTEPRDSLRYWFMVSVMAASVVAGASRTGSILVVAEVIAVPLLAMWRGMAPGRAAALGLGHFLLFAALCTAVVGWDVLWQRFQQADPYVGRREMLLSSIQMVRERPLTGFGLGTWSTAYPAYALYDDGSFANQAHNDWAQWAVEGGAPLFLMMLAFALLLLAPAWRSLWGLGLISVLIHCTVDYPMQQRPALAGWFFALAGALAAADRQFQKRSRAA